VGRKSPSSRETKERSWRPGVWKKRGTLGKGGEARGGTERFRGGIPMDHSREGPPARKRIGQTGKGGKYVQNQPGKGLP